jgi:putative DNA primase/helicase
MSLASCVGAKASSKIDAEALFARWLAARGGPGAAEPEQIVAHVRRLLEQHGDSRFDDLDQPEPFPYGGGEKERRPVINRLGSEEARETREWWVLPEVWRAEFCDSHDPGTVAKTLADRGMLEKGDGKHLAKRVRIEGRLIRAYVLTPAIFYA